MLRMKMALDNPKTAIVSTVVPDKLTPICRSAMDFANSLFEDDLWEEFARASHYRR